MVACIWLLPHSKIHSFFNHSIYLCSSRLILVLIIINWIVVNLLCTKLALLLHISSIYDLVDYRIISIMCSWKDPNIDSQQYIVLLNCLIYNISDLSLVVFGQCQRVFNVCSSTDVRLSKYFWDCVTSWLKLYQFRVLGHCDEHISFCHSSTCKYVHVSLSEAENTHKCWQ